MKKILGYLRNHLREDFDAFCYIIIFIFLGLSIYLNFRWNFYNDFLRQQTGAIRFVYFFTFYAIPFFFTVGTYAIVLKKKEVFKKKQFWIKCALAIGAIALSNGLPFYWDWVDVLFAPPIRYWTFKVLNYLIGFFTVLAPLLIYYKFYEQKEKHIYGLAPKQFDVKPYFIMLLIVIPLIASAAFHGSFLAQYPMYKLSGASKYFGIPEWLSVFIFESAYAFDFISVEFLFRGFMVIGMMAVLGRSSVLTMAAVYCFLHFGKPPGEAISSIFGGYLLGVIAHETKSIWGGIIVHIGVAMTMELSAYLVR